jgi:hypothetical protein
LSAGRSLCLLHLSEQNFTSVAAVFAEFDFLEPVYDGLVSIYVVGDLMIKK